MPEHARNSGVSGAEVSAVAVSKENFLGKLKVLKMDKSPRPDGLHPRVLKR